MDHADEAILTLFGVEVNNSCCNSLHDAEGQSNREIFHFEPTLDRNYQEANLSNSGSMRTLVFMTDVRLTLPTFLIACLLGCQEERASGALYLTWKFGAFSCEQAAVTNVSAKVYNYDGYEAVVEASGDCEAEGLQVQDVPAGDYTLVLQG